MNSPYDDNELFVDVESYIDAIEFEEAKCNEYPIIYLPKEEE